MSIHAIDTGEHEWEVPSPATTMFDFDYTGGREQLLRLYDKGTRRQWIGSDRLDWSGDLDRTTPSACPTTSTRSFGTTVVGQNGRRRTRPGAPALRGVAV